MNELKILLTEGYSPCEVEENKYLKELISCPTYLSGCTKCIWEKGSHIHPKVLDLIPIIELE